MREDAEGWHVAACSDRELWLVHERHLYDAVIELAEVVQGE